MDVDKKRISSRLPVIGMLLVLFCFVLSVTVYGAPSDIAAGDKLLLGIYQDDSGQFLVRERDELLEILDISQSKEGGGILREYAAFPLQKKFGDEYILNGSNLFSRQSISLVFQRDQEGRGIVFKAGDRSFFRQFCGPEKGETFRIKPLLPAKELKEKFHDAKPPVEKGSFMQSDLVEVVALDNSIHLDIRYATDNNFMGFALYDEARAFLQRPAAQALVRVQQKLINYDLGLVIHDAYRPWYVTKLFWEATPEQQRMFVADPDKGSRHNRGGAVDVSLYDLKTGKEIKMISTYDEFSFRAYSDYPGGTSLERWQRELLRVLMEGEGFTIYPEEWWHYDYYCWEKYPILNIPFQKIK